VDKEDRSREKACMQRKKERMWSILTDNTTKKKSSNLPKISLITI